MARAGYAAKGSVYGLTGILTFLAALDLGGEKTSQLEVMEFLEDQHFGNFLLILMGLGLVSYAGWRFTQSIFDPEETGNDKKAILKRTGFFTSGCIYLGLAVLAFLRIFNNGGSNGASGNAGGQSSWLSSDIGLSILGAIGLIIIGVGIFQFIRVYKSEYKRKFDLERMSDKKQETIKDSAYLGMSSRGILFLITGYSAVHAAITSNPSEIKTTSDAFSFIQDSSYGSWLLALVAAGLVFYSIYMFMMTGYRKFMDGNSSNS